MTQSTGSSGSPGDAAQEKVSQVAQTAKDSGTQVAQTAAEQAKTVSDEASRQARDLIGEARDQLRDQAGDQQQRLASGLRGVVDELRSMAGKGGQSGPATELVRQAADRAQRAADWLEQRQPGDDLISRARQQLAAVTDEFQRGLASVKNPAQRRRLTAGYVDTVQKYLAKAQEGLAHYRDKLQSSNTANPDGQPPDQLADRGIA